MKNRTAIVIFLFAFFCSTFTIANAKWKLPIHPGDHVFDAKRFADSVKETAKTVLVVQNALESLKNKILINTKINSSLNNVMKEIKNLRDNPNGDSLINPKNVYEDTPFWGNWEINEAMNDTSYKEKLNKEIANNNKEAAQTVQQVSIRQGNRQEEINDVLEMETEGVLGEKQKENAVAILENLERIDKARISGAQMINEITLHEAEYADQRLDQEKVKAGQFYGYDPYHPNDYDNSHKPIKESFGFLKFGE